MPEKSRVEGGHSQSYTGNEHCGWMRWAKGPRGGAKPPPKRPIRRAISGTKALGHLSLLLLCVCVRACVHVRLCMYVYKFSTRMNASLHVCKVVNEAIHPAEVRDTVWSPRSQPGHAECGQACVNKWHGRRCWHQAKPGCSPQWPIVRQTTFDSFNQSTCPMCDKAS